MKSSRAQVLLSIIFGMSSPLLEYLDPTSPQNTAKLESWSSRAPGPLLGCNMGGIWVLNLIRRHSSLQSCHMSYSLNSLKGGYIGDYIGDYYREY